MKNFYNCLLIIMCILSAQLCSYAQCTQGPFAVDPASASILPCSPGTTDPCFPFTSRQEFQISVPAGMQVCYEIPNDEIRFSMCNTTQDDTFITIFDAFGDVISSSDNVCGLQPSLTLNTTLGDIICIQVESVTGGICDGTASMSSSYNVDITCISNYVQEFNDAITCQNVGFNEIQTFTSETGLSFSDIDPNPYVFNVGTDPELYTTGSITICAQGDFTNDEEIWELLDENGNCFGGIGGIPDAGCDNGPFCTSINFDASEVADLVADGMVSFAVIAQDDINTNCDSVFVSLELNLCSMPPIPTMGEWGLLCLGLILLCISIVAIKQRHVVLINKEL